MNTFIEYELNFPESERWAITGWSFLPSLILIGILWAVVLFDARKKAKAGVKVEKSGGMSGAAFMAANISVVLVLAGIVVQMFVLNSAQTKYVTEQTTMNLTKAGVQDARWDDYARSYVGKFDGEVFYGKRIQLEGSKTAIVRVTDENAVLFTGN